MGYERPDDLSLKGAVDLSPPDQKIATIDALVILSSLTGQFVGQVHMGISAAMAKNQADAAAAQKRAAACVPGIFKMLALVCDDVGIQINIGKPGGQNG